MSDISERFAEGESGNAISSTFPVDEETGNTPVWKLAQSLLVGLLAPNVGELRGGAELAPPDCVLAVKDERGVRLPLPD